jgi:AcrR family transcriptional regulator
MSRAKRKAAPRSREETEQRLVQAVEDILRDEGFAALGVNAVAARAGVDKVLIYRYFDGLPGLLRRFAESGAFWPSLDEVLGPDRELLCEPDPARLGARLLSAYGRALRARPVTLELLAWECSQRNELTPVLEEVRERWGMQVLAALPKGALAEGPRANAAAALLSAAVNYLALRARHIRHFTGVDIQSNEGWAALEAAMEGMLRGLLAGPS